jgi:hypothetical protein
MCAERTNPKKVAGDTVYCVCGLPDDHRLYVLCCGPLHSAPAWFHADCLPLTAGLTPEHLEEIGEQQSLLCAEHTREQRAREVFTSSEMYQQGFLVVRKAVEFGASAVRDLEALSRSAAPIFNGGNDRRRKQVRAGRWTWLQEIGRTVLLCAAAADPSAQIPAAPGALDLDWHILVSEPGCQPQQAHSDYLFNAEMLARHNSPRVNYGLIVAVQDGTMWDVWPGAHRLVLSAVPPSTPVERCTVQLDRGDAVLFRADCIHAGSGYNTKNIRLHAYVSRVGERGHNLRFFPNRVHKSSSIFRGVDQFLANSSGGRGRTPR